MKITLSFSAGDAGEISETRRVLDLLSAELGVASSTPTVPALVPGVPPPAPPPPAVAPPAAAPPPAPSPPTTTSPTLTELARKRAEAAGIAPPASTVPVGGAPPGAGTAPPSSGRAPELDSARHSWDERFHVKSKSKIKDGTWRRKRGVTQEEVVVALASNVPEGASEDVVPPTPPLAPTPPAANGEVTWEGVVEAFQARAQKYTQDQIQAALRSAVIEPTTLFQFPDQYAAAVAALDAQCPM